MHKPQCFIVYRDKSGRIAAKLASKRTMSGFAMWKLILETDPFQNAVQREWQSARSFLSLADSARAACANRWVSQ